LKHLDHAEIESYLSTPRLDAYRVFFSPNSNVELIGCYLWSKELASSFFPLLQMLEVTLRNSIHKEARNRIGSYWFDNIAHRSNPTSNQQRVIRSATNAIESARSQLRNGHGRNYHVHEDKIIAKVTFGFWTNLLHTAFEVNRNNNALWPMLLRPTFPNCPQRHRTRDNFHATFKTIKTFRNKAFHHEPLWNIGRPPNLNMAISNLLKSKDTLLQAIRWMSLDCHELMYKAGYVSRIEKTCTTEYLDYLKFPDANKVAISQAKRNMNSLLKKKHLTVDVVKNSFKIATIETN
jgi:hypothetical protein